MSSQLPDDGDWEDLVRRLGGTPEQAGTPPASEPYTPQEDLPMDHSLDGPRDYQVVEEDTAFQPAPPKSLSTVSPRAILSWIGVVGSIAFWTITALFRVQVSVWLTLATIFMFIVGAVSLFFLLPKNRDPYGSSDDDDFGNGARL